MLMQVTVKLDVNWIVAEFSHKDFVRLIQQSATAGFTLVAASGKQLSLVSKWYQGAKSAEKALLRLVEGISSYPLVDAFEGSFLFDGEEGDGHVRITIVEDWGLALEDEEVSRLIEKLIEPLCDEALFE